MADRLMRLHNHLEAQHNVGHDQRLARDLEDRIGSGQSQNLERDFGEAESLLSRYGF
ncbi:hypothetical protein [Aquitalea magnusonii]|uniref:hypothetical protein n=1 Tax=Aquitalea magnusonii TaxID=332411 RepID=UPI00142E0691|nr:hypothetical protein [Aquitalea magnusonii]